MNMGDYRPLSATINRCAVATMPHSIFIQERKSGRAKPPELVAYDIDSISLANRLVRHIAKSFQANGHDPATGRRWFKLKKSIFDIYRWRQ